MKPAPAWAGFVVSEGIDCERFRERGVKMKPARWGRAGSRASGEEVLL